MRHTITTVKIMRNLILHTFKCNYTKVVGKQGCERRKTNAAFFHKFGNMPIMQAYSIFKTEYEERGTESARLHDKVNKFERYLISQNARCVQSNKSESRYYYYKCKKYRFSSHIYPTGSMTNDLLGVVDLCADKCLIDEIEKELNITL